MQTFEMLWIAIAQIKKSPSSYMYASVIVAIAVSSVIVGISAAIGFGKSLPVPEGEAVLRVRVIDPEGGISSISVSDWNLWRTNIEMVDGLGAFSRSYSLIDIAGGVIEARIAYVTEDIGDILKVDPIIGHWPSETDSGVVVISHQFWKSLFRGNIDVLGKEVVIGNESRVIVGVMPEGFQFPFLEEIWEVVSPNSPKLQNIEVIFRVNGDSSPTELSEEFQSLFREAENGRIKQAEVLGFTEGRGEIEEQVLLGAMLFVALGMSIVACTNVFNLVSEQALIRAPELAVHQSIGANTSTVVMQLLVESALISMMGAGLGYLAAFFGSEFLIATVGEYIGYYWITFDLDLSTSLVVVFSSVIVTTFAGSFAVFQILTKSIVENLNVNSSSVQGTRKSVFSWIMINAQLSLSCVVVTLAFVVAISALNRQGINENLTDNLWLAQVSFEGELYEDSDELTSAKRLLISVVENHPMVIMAALVSGNFLTQQLVTVTAPERPQQAEIVSSASYVSRHFFDVIGLNESSQHISLDDFESTGVWVNQAVANEILGNTAVRGENLRIFVSEDTIQELPLNGSVSNVQLVRRDIISPSRMVYLPLEQTWQKDYTLLVRYEDGSKNSNLFADMNNLGPLIGPFSNLGDLLAYQSRLFTTLGKLVVLGATISLIMLVIGLFALISLELESQKKEIALRKVLGATEYDIWLRIVSQAFMSSPPGILLGVGFIMQFSYLFGSVAEREIGIGILLLLIFSIYLVTIFVATGLSWVKQAKYNPAQMLSEG